MPVVTTQREMLPSVSSTSNETEEEILNFEFSDRELELAAGILMCTSDTVNSRYACTRNPCCFCR
jgi:hypothetical protein